MAMSESERMHLAAEHEGGGAGVFLASMPAALALVVLGILALARVDPLLLVSIAAIVAGVLLVSDSAAITRELASALSAKMRHHIDSAELASGLTAGVLGGIIGVVLGILALLDVAPHTLIAVAAIVFGGAVLFDFVARSQVRALRMTTGETPEQSAKLAMATASSTCTAALFTGVGLVTLGILALAGIASNVLMAVAFLGLGAYVLLEDAAMTERITGFLGQ
jgi:hypothetical protein